MAGASTGGGVMMAMRSRRMSISRPGMSSRSRGPAQMLRHRLRIEGRRFAFMQGYRSLRTFSKADPEPVAVVVANQNGLAVHKLDRSFRARSNAESATVALLLVDPDDLALHVLPFEGAPAEMSGGAPG